MSIEWNHRSCGLFIRDFSLSKSLQGKKTTNQTSVFHVVSKRSNHYLEEKIKLTVKTWLRFHGTTVISNLESEDEIMVISTQRGAPRERVMFCFPKTQGFSSGIIWTQK